MKRVGLLTRPCLLKILAVLEKSTSQDIQVCCRCAVGVHFGYLIVYKFSRFRCAENHTQDNFRCVMVCYLTQIVSKDKAWLTLGKQKGVKRKHRKLIIVSNIVVD